ncbi:hypothetical protein C8J56DRAFT_920150 [Mycena floridula]|nr:hypothetical protein C8J56DRAFT_920150 [Mycena floridula]
MSRRRYASLAVGSVLCLFAFSLFNYSPSPYQPVLDITMPEPPLPQDSLPPVLEPVVQPVVKPVVEPVVEPVVAAPEVKPVVVDPYGPESSLQGAPTQSFRDNLKPNEKYITSWISAGWTNDVMTYGNLLYLAVITGRIPIMPMFTPSHIGGGVAPVAFGEVFDVPRLRKLMGRPVLEWKEVKDERSEFRDQLGCWNGWEAVQYREANPRYSIVPQHLKIDLSYTKMPSWIKLIPNFEHDQHSTFWALARFGWPQTRAETLASQPPSPSLTANFTAAPDEQLLCYDYLYFVCAHQPYEYDNDFSPAWQHAGAHMHFLPDLEVLADRYVRRAFGFSDADPRSTPPFIGIHVRHLDFAVYCGELPLHDCFAPLPVIARRVKEVQDELLATKGILVEHVVMTSDERNETWWQEVTEVFGWSRLHHLEWAGAGEPREPAITPIKGAPEGLRRWHDWYPLLIDATVQSAGVGFVGTDRSTMTIIARRRVETWQGGASRIVKWGTIGADDH